MKKLVVMITMLLVLVGCGGSASSQSNAKEQVVYTKETASGISTKYEIGYDGDTIVDVKRTYEATIVASMFERNTLEELEQLYTVQYIDPEKEVDGIEHDIKISEEDKKLTVISDINVEKAKDIQLPTVFEITTLDTMKNLEKELVGLGFTVEKDK
ncbi:MAG: hypothetical protein ACK5LC_16805 [Coprobacillaceae bacterium]